MLQSKHKLNLPTIAGDLDEVFFKNFKIENYFWNHALLIFQTCCCF